MRALPFLQLPGSQNLARKPLLSWPRELEHPGETEGLTKSEDKRQMLEIWGLGKGWLRGTLSDYSQGGN